MLKLIDIGDMTINGAYTETKRHLNFISLSEYVSKRKKDIPLNIENLTIYNKSSEDMVEVENDSVQTIVTSPPYYQKRSYQVDGQIGLAGIPQSGRLLYHYIQEGLFAKSIRML